MTFTSKLPNSHELGRKASGFLSRMAGAYTASTERLYLNAVKNPRTGRFDAALERQVALMILR